MSEQMQPVRFGVIGLNHGHIYGQVSLLERAGARCVGVWAAEPELLADFTRAYPHVPVAASADALLHDPTIDLIVSAAIPNERSAIGVAAMRHGKDYMSDKPGFTTLAQLEEARKVQVETGRMYSICYSERFENAATVRAGELVQAGVIGRVVQTIGLGPHRRNLPSRPSWFFERERYGGILTDIGSHQADQFLFFTGSTEAEVVASQVANYHHPEYPELEDWGDVVVRGNGGTGYIRVDWFTPDGLATWGDTRLTILGTDGYIEIRKNIDIAGQPGSNHLFLVDAAGTHRVVVDPNHLPYGTELLDDIRHRTETAMTQAHCFLASELILRAEAQATRLGNL